MTLKESYQTVLEFWFSDRARARWFNSTKVFDTEIRDRFLETYTAASKEELFSWEDSPEGALALVILLDQLPLNIFRNQPESFATEALSREVAERAIAKGHDRSLSDEQKSFLYMPYMHSEEMEDQDKSVALFEGAGLMNNLKWAQHHRGIVERFGRFPHRNAILQRTSTPEEIEYLASKEAFNG
jgi:uncharacterized protein (DUF924 family)